MPRSRGSQMPQKQSPRGRVQLRTSSSDSDPLHHRPITDRSPKLGDRRSPRGVPSDGLNQKKLGTRIADLESQLGQAQEELKNLKSQLASAEAAKKEAEKELENKKVKKVPKIIESEVKHLPSIKLESNKEESNHPDEISEETQQETDVFEVPIENVSVELTPHAPEEEDKKMEPVELFTETQSNYLNELCVKNDEISMLNVQLEQKKKELEVTSEENDSLKKCLTEATSEVSLLRAKEEEMSLKVNKLGEEMEASKSNVFQLREKLKTVEGEKEELEKEMKTLRVQTKQWRKAADAAASVLAGGGVEINGRRVNERCVSMEKHFGGLFETRAGGYAGFVGSPGMIDDVDDGFEVGKRKGSGIRMFGDLWKKKGSK